MNHLQCHVWFKHFSWAEPTVEDHQQICLLLTNDKNISDAVHSVICAKCHFTVWELTENVRISSGSCHEINWRIWHRLCHCKTRVMSVNQQPESELCQYQPRAACLCLWSFSSQRMSLHETKLGFLAMMWKLGTVTEMGWENVAPNEKMMHKLVKLGSLC